MDIAFLRRLLLFVILLLAQVLVLNHIHLFDYATPCYTSILSSLSSVVSPNGEYWFGAFC